MKPKIYVRNFNGILDGIIDSDELERVDDPRNADCIVLWQDVRGEFAELAKINKKYLHKPLVVVQHGAGGTRDYGHPENFPLLADKFCCWGPADYERLVKFGYGDRAVITGSTLINQIRPLNKHPEKNIVFCPVVTHHEEPSNLIVFYELKKIELDYSQKNIIKHKSELEETWKPSIFNPENELGENTIPYIDINRTFRLIAKLTTLHDKSLYLGSVCETDVNSSAHIEGCIRLLTYTDVVVGMVESTFQMLAMAMGIPVIICKEWEFKNYAGKDYTGCDHIKTSGVTYCDLKNLREVVEGELENPKKLEKERKETVLREFGDIYSDPDTEVVKVIKELVNSKTNVQT